LPAPPSTSYDGSIADFQLNAIPQDPVMTPQGSVKAGMITSRYIESEENTSMHAAGEKGEGEPETPKTGCTPTWENSNSNDAMTEVEWTE
jgi:hypothetical protein